MTGSVPVELLQRFLRASPEQQAAIARILGWPGEAANGQASEVRGQKAEVSGEHGAWSEERGADRIVTHGRLRYLPGFNDVWLGDTHYDLRERTKARLCIQYLVEQRAFDAASARHLTEEIDPYVRKHGDYLRSVDIKIDHYFKDQKGRLPQLRKELVVAAGRHGRYFLKVE